MKRILIILAVIIIWISVLVSSNAFGFSWKGLESYFPNQSNISAGLSNQKVKILTEESVITDAVDKVSPSVVTVSVSQTRSVGSIFNNNNDPFGFFPPQQTPQTQNVEQDIGSGFIVSKDGMIVTNKHVVSDTSAKYKVITNDNKSYDVTNIYRDPANDLAIIKIDASGLPVVNLGDSSGLKVGQMAIAIGTALGEFRQTVTTGVISGLGRGITAGSPYEGEGERRDNGIQTDAAINPGNSGGPLLNSSAQVIGINTAVSQQGQNIGFAIPVNVVVDALNEFNKTGSFQRPYLGVHYRMVTRNLAVLNDLPEGAYVQDIVAGSPAEKAGIQADDIVTKIDNNRITDQNGGLAKAIAGKKVGDSVKVEVWRNGETMTFNVTLSESTGQ